MQQIQNLQEPAPLLERIQYIRDLHDLLDELLAVDADQACRAIDSLSDRDAAIALSGLKTLIDSKGESLRKNDSDRKAKILQAEAIIATARNLRIRGLSGLEEDVG